MAAIRALAFDAYGTLYDPASVFQRCEQLFPGHGEAISDIWRVKQLQYTWLRSLMGRYQDFHRLTEDGLRFACRSLSLELGDGPRRELMAEYFRLAPYPEVPAALERLQARLPLAILSNGTPEMLERVSEHNGLRDRFRQILSVDELQVFKPSPRVYQLAVDRLGVPAEAIGFVSSNAWDVAGAKAFGLRVFWINRFRKPPEELGERADHEVHSMDEIADWVERQA